MADLHLNYIRQLMGDPWVNNNVFGENPAHLLGQWQKKDPDNVWVPYTEELVKSILTNTKITLDRVSLAQKLRAEYVATLAEIETAVFLAHQGFAVVLEPMAPQKGPDLRADWEQTPYFVEVRAVGQSEDDDQFNLLSGEIFSRLNSVPSSYMVVVTIGDEYAPGSSAFKSALTAILESLGIVKREHWQRATLYHSASGSLLNSGGDFDPSFARGNYQEIVAKADLVARFTDIGIERENTLGFAERPFKQVPEPDQTHERLKKILNKKRTQLPANSRGVIVFDVSDLFMLTDFTIESALYGDLEVMFAAPANPGGPIGEPNAKRNNRGFFRQTSRVSAVVFHKRAVKDQTVISEWSVYPTKRANADTKQLSLAELQRFGDLGDRKHLSAEKILDLGNE